MERLVRHWTQMTPEDVQTLADTTPPERYSKGGMYAEGPWNSPETEVLVGREFKASFSSGVRFTFRFTGKNSVVWTENGGGEHEDFCQAHLCPGYDMIYFVNMFCKGSKPPRTMAFRRSIRFSYCSSVTLRQSGWETSSKRSKGLPISSSLPVFISSKVKSTALPRLWEDFPAI